MMMIMMVLFVVISCRSSHAQATTRGRRTTATSASSTTSTATTTTTTAASTTTTSRSKHDKGPVCPSARCNLVSQRSFDALDAQVTALFDRLVATVTEAEGIFVIGGPNTCEKTSSESTFVTTCSKDESVGANPKTAFFNVACPDGFSSVDERDCVAIAYDLDMNRIGLLPLLKSGSLGTVSWCEVDISGLPEDTQVHIEHNVRCSNLATVVPTLAARQG